MKSYNLLEKIGMVTAVVGVMFTIAKVFYTGQGFAAVLNLDQIFIWGGILIWGLGYMRKEQAAKGDAE